MSDDESIGAYGPNSTGLHAKSDAFEQDNLRRDLNELKMKMNYTEPMLKKIYNSLESNENIDEAIKVSQSSFNSMLDTNIKLIWDKLNNIEPKLNRKFDSQLKDLLKNSETDLKEKISNINLINQQLKESLEHLQEKSEQNNYKIEDILRDCIKHGSQIENLDKDLHNVNKNISEMETKQTQLSFNLDENNSTLNSNRKELESINLQLKSNSNEIDTLKNMDLTINRVVTELNQSQTSALESINTLKDNVQLLYNNLEALDGQHNKLDQKFKKCNQNQDKLYNSLLETEQRSKQNEALANDIEKWKEETSKRLDSNDRDADKFRADTSLNLDKQGDEFKKLSVAKNLMENKLQELDKTSIEEKNKVYNLNCRIQDQSTEISQLKQELHNCMQVIKELKNKVDSNETTLQKLNIDNSMVQKIQGDLGTKIAKIEGTRSALSTNPHGPSNAASGHSFNPNNFFKSSK